MGSQVTYALLYRTQREWRITVRTPDELARGALTGIPASVPFDTAVREFEALLKSAWGVDGTLSWDEFKPDWWGVDVVPGALRAAGERSD